MKKKIFIVLLCFVSIAYVAAEQVHIADPATWNSSALAFYVGQRVTFDVPMYLINSYGTRLSPYCVATNGDANVVSISNAPGDGRPRLFSHDLTAKVVQSGSGYALQYLSGSFDGNTRADILRGPDFSQIDVNGQHTLLVCAANLEYYLKECLGTGMGPDNIAEHERQRAKTRQALAMINADIYGLCEVEQGKAALQEICTDLNAAHPERKYTFVFDEAASVASSFTMSAIVYDANVVSPFSKFKAVPTEVKFRKYLQCFTEIASSERFILSMNHFKAMSGGGDTETRRIAEANAVNSACDSYTMYCSESDVLIMGDLNCHYGSVPITILLDQHDRVDLHRYFHPEGSYSYVYGGVPNYLDHAICSPTMLPQVTGMQAFHINSDENDCYTYNGGCDDGSMFRYSDHDPILVGLRLNSRLNNEMTVLNYGSDLRIRDGEGGYVRVYDMYGKLLFSQPVDSDEYTISFSEHISGCYVVHAFHNGINHVTKYIRP